MSLKAFHVFFVSISVVLMLVIGAWCLGNYRADGGVMNLVWAIAAFLVAGGLVTYGKYFVRKFKNISYL